MKNKSIYTVWKSMRQRCNNPNATSYKRYGAKGISVCDEWDSFSNFELWSSDSGYSEGMNLHRIDKTNGYCPSNCEWSFLRPSMKRDVDCKSRDPLHVVWSSMIKRCYNKNHKSYHRYGGRGIVVYFVWKDDSSEFIRWARNHGWQAGLQLDRIDNNKGYYPDNCRFVTPKENANNRG